MLRVYQSRISVRATLDVGWCDATVEQVPVNEIARPCALSLVRGFILATKHQPTPIPALRPFQLTVTHLTQFEPQAANAASAVTKQTLGVPLGHENSLSGLPGQHAVNAP